MALALLFGVSLGIWAALRQNHWQDYSVMGVAMIGITIPTFVTRADPDPDLRRLWLVAVRP